MLHEGVKRCPNSVAHLFPLRQGSSLETPRRFQKVWVPGFAFQTLPTSPTKGNPFGNPPGMQKTSPDFSFPCKDQKRQKENSMGQYCVLHMEVRAEVSSILERHIVRKEVQYVDGVRRETVWIPDNADESRVHLNRELVSRTVTDPSTGKAKTLTIQQAVNRRIEDAGITKVRRNQNTCIEVIFSGSPETMRKMSQKQVNNWANDTLAWARDQWGYENVVSATLHCDETTPHMHVIVVPIVQGQSRRSALKKRMDAAKGVNTRKYKTDTTKNRLCANEVYSKPLLYGFHTSYAETVGEKYGLSRGVRAELGSYKKHTTSIEYNRQLAEEATEKERLIKELTANYSKLTSAVEIVNTELSVQKQKMSLQETTIANNDAIIQNQEKQKASVVINYDAAEKQIAEQYASIAELAEKEKRLQRSFTDKMADFDTLSKKVEHLKQQLAVKGHLLNIPKKGTFGYNTKEVESFIESVKAANHIYQMNCVPQDSNPNEELQNEVYHLRRIEDDYQKLINSPELLQERIEQLKKEPKRKEIEETLKYALNFDDLHVLHFTVEKTDKGEDIFAKFSIIGTDEQWAGRITPNERVYYTMEPDINSLQDCKNNSHRQIWVELGSLDDIRQQREKEDVKSRLSNKLTKLLEKRITVTDYQVEGEQYLVFAKNGRSYVIDPDGSTWSTNDNRVKTIDDCNELAGEAIWDEHGNINLQQQGRRAKK